MAAHPAVGSFAREVRAKMTALFASTAAAISRTGLVRKKNQDSACTGRWLPAADGGPGGELARPSTTIQPAVLAGTLACSRRCSHGTWTAGQPVRLLSASVPAAAACCARRTQRGHRRPTAPECTNFAHRAGQSHTPTAPPDQRVPAGPVPLCKLRQYEALPLPLLRPAENPRPQISRDTRCHDPPGATAALLAARGARAMRRTMPLALARSIRAQ